METIIYTLGMVLLWLLNFIKGTGLGHAYNVLGITKILCVAVAVLFAMRKKRRESRIQVDRQYFYTILLMVSVFVGVSLVRGNRWDAVDYLWSYLVVFVLSETRPTRNTLQLTGLAYCAMGLVVMIVYLYTDVMKGWDGNSVALVGLSSFLVFLIPYYGVRDLRSKLVLVLAGVVFGVLFWQTESRSCIFAAALALLVFFGIIPFNGLLKSRRGLTIIMLVPLVVAILTVIVTTIWDVSVLDAWSMEKFQKPIFNGRDKAWIEGFGIIRENFWLGTGKINAGYWHNSAIACLTAYGVVGYLLWTNLFRIILLDGMHHSDEVCVAGCMASFLVIYIQQAMELGLMAPNPNLLPYAMLGLILGRSSYIKEKLW